jgi:hypothetical protein
MQPAEHRRLPAASGKLLLRNWARKENGWHEKKIFMFCEYSFPQPPELSIETVFRGFCFFLTFIYLLLCLREESV